MKKKTKFKIGNLLNDKIDGFEIIVDFDEKVFKLFSFKENRIYRCVEKILVEDIEKETLEIIL